MIKRELGSVCSRLSSGKSIRAENINPIGAYPVIGGNGLRGYTDSYNFDGECAVIGRQGAACGNVRYHSGKAYMTEHAVVVCANDDNDTRYLSYLLSIQNLGRLSAQSAQPGISVKTLSKQEVCLPPLDKQKQVSQLLGTIDSKINANTKLNDYLLQLSTTIFESALKSECRKELFGDIVELEDSKRIPLNSRDREQRRGPYPYYGATSIMGYVDDYLFDDIRILLGEDGSVITDDGRPVLQYVWGKYWVNNHAHILKPCSDYSLEMLFIALSRTTISHIVTGAVQKKISQKNLNTLVLEMPSPGHVEELCGLFSLYRANIDQNKRLEQLRDALLPKLMAGKIDVSRIDITTQSNNHLGDC